MRSDRLFIGSKPFPWSDTRRITLSGEKKTFILAESAPECRLVFVERLLGYPENDRLYQLVQALVVSLHFKRPL
jgi:hypothetical protein